MVNSILRIDDGLFKLEGVIIFVLFVALIVMLTIQVLFRFALNQPLDFTEEIARLLFAWLIFIGGARALRVSQHFLVDLLYKVFPGGLQRLIGYLIDFITIAFCATLAWVGFSASIKGASQILPVMQISASTHTLALPVGFALMFFHAICFPLRRKHIGDPMADAYAE